jgi:hypothetical protein
MISMRAISALLRQLEMVGPEIETFLGYGSTCVRRLGYNYNCTVYLNRQVTDNMYHVGGDPRMRKGCRAHRRKVVGRMMQLWPLQDPEIETSEETKCSHRKVKMLRMFEVQ